MPCGILVTSCECDFINYTYRQYICRKRTEVQGDRTKTSQIFDRAIFYHLPRHNNCQIVNCNNKILLKKKSENKKIIIFGFF